MSTIAKLAAHVSMVEGFPIIILDVMPGAEAPDPRTLQYYPSQYDNYPCDINARLSRLLGRRVVIAIAFPDGRVAYPRDYASGRPFCRDYRIDHIRREWQAVRGSIFPSEETE
jgi:hypothetical protein